MDIRDATETDALGILRIYNDAVVNTTAIWNDQPSTLESRVAWLRERQQSGYPVVVAADGSNIVGYASFGAFRPAIATPSSIPSMSTAPRAGWASATP
jgi:phosphinothricin acetyltransferase